MALSIYVYENGEITWDILNAVSMFFHNQSFGEMMSIAGALAIFLTGATFVVKRDPNVLVKYFFTFLFVPLFLVNTTSDVEVINLGDPLWTKGTVSNVPMIIAYPAHLTSEISYGVTTLVEDIFHTDDNATYTKTGMIYASKVQRATQQASIQSGHLRQLWSEYLRNCIRPDILINGKYTWDEFANSNNIFEFLTTHSPSPLRRIVDREGGTIEYPTCRDALPTIEALFDQEANSQLSFLGKKLGFLTENKAQQAALLASQIVENDTNFIGMSSTAKDTLVQNMAINGIRTGLRDAAAHSNATAAQLNYANTKMELQNEQMWMSLGLMAQKYIPELHSLLFLLILVSPIFVIFLAMLPAMTFKVLTNYVYGYAYLATWPPMFVIINFFMSKTLEMESIDIANLSQGLTFSNANEIYHAHIYFAAICGWLLSTVPFIAPYVVKGGASIMGSLSMQVAGMINSASGQAASENASGNYNLANTSMDNHNANKTDLRFMQQTHGAAIQNSNGTITTQLGHGMVYDAHGSISKTPFTINGQDAVQHSLTDSLTKAHKATQSTSATFNDALNATTNDLMSLSHLSSDNKNYAHSTSDGLSATQQQSINQMNSAVNDYAKTHNVSKDTAWKAMIEGYGDAHMDGGFKLFGNGVQVRGGIKGSIGGSYGHNDSDSNTDRHSISDQKSFNDAFNTLRQSSQNDTTGHQNSKLDQALRSFTADNQELISSSQQYSHALAHEQSLSNTLQQVKSGSLQVSSNLLPEFQSFLENNEHAKDHVQQLMTGSNPILAEERQAYLKQFIDQKVESGDGSLFVGNTADSLPTETQFNQQHNQDVETMHQRYNQSQKVAQHGHLDAEHEYFDEATYQQKADQANDNLAHRQEVVDTANVPSHQQEPPSPIMPKFSDIDKASAEGADWRAFEGKPNKPDIPDMASFDMESIKKDIKDKM